MQKRKGISLIVLVITIIVMIILAGAIILTLNNSGIIDKASDVIEQTNYATVKELAQMAWAEAYANGARTVEGENGLQAAVDQALIDNKVDTEKYVVEVTTKGVNVVLKGPWVQTGETVTDGKVTINVGEKINYTATGTSYSGDWKVLGASEDGELLIMSDSDVARHSLGGKLTTDLAQGLKESQNAWLNGAAELDEICEAYGKGTGATGARSVTVEDINRVTGYDPETEKYGKGRIGEYGNVVTYSYNGTTMPAYSGSNGASGVADKYHSDWGFYFYNGIEFVHVNVNDLEAGTSGTTFATLTNDYYTYWPEITEEAELLLLGEIYDEEMGWRSASYWLADHCISGGSIVTFEMRIVEENQVLGANLWRSDGDFESHTYGVRPVVTIATGVKISGDAAGGWKINI